jgi:hypothetical protein
MSKTYTQTKTHALLLANDTTFSSTDADALLDEIYQRYWYGFLKDRIKLVTGFLTYADTQFVVTNASAAREIINLEANAGTATTAAPVLPLQRDDFHAVCADAANAVKSATTQRWGAEKVQGSSFFRVAIFPPASGALTFDAEVFPEYTTPSGATALEGDDVDAFNVARLAACEIMVRNGEDAEDIAKVFSLLDEAIKQKFVYITRRGRPNERATKEQA